MLTKVITFQNQIVPVFLQYLNNKHRQKNPNIIEFEEWGDRSVYLIRYKHLKRIWEEAS